MQSWNYVNASLTGNETSCYLWGIIAWLLWLFVVDWVGRNAMASSLMMMSEARSGLSSTSIGPRSSANIDFSAYLLSTSPPGFQISPGGFSCGLPPSQRLYSSNLYQVVFNRGILLYILAGHIPPGYFRIPDNFPHLHGVGHFPFHHRHPPVNSIKRSTVNVYETDRSGSVRVRSTG